MTRLSPKAEQKHLERLKKLRETIDRLDRSLIRTLSRRFEAACKIGEIKRAMGEPVVQARRSAEILRTRKRHAREVGIDPAFIARIFEFIQKEAIALQKKQLKKMRRKA